MAEALTRSGWAILSRNWRAGRGELDIVARKAGKLRFVEVKLRSSIEDALSSITSAKRRRLISAAEAWLCVHREPFEDSCFALAVVLPGPTPSIHWFDNPFDGG